MRTFDKIFIVNLHGSANKKETTPEGGKDENIFDIMQGVSLFIGVKTTKKTDWAKVYYTDLWGSRANKLDSLSKDNLEFTELSLDPRMAYFIPFGDEKKDAYDNFIRITDLFPTNVTGIVSGRDKAAITYTRDELIRRIDIVKNSTDDQSVLDIWKKFTDGQTATTIRDDVLSDGAITPIAFHPFDSRWTYYSGASCGWIFRPREKKTIGHLLHDADSPIGKNIGLVFCRTSRYFFTPFVADTIIASRLFSAMCEITYISPLYLFNHSDIEGDSWVPNIDEESYNKLTQYMPEKPSPIEVFDYVYGILHDPVYCKEYEQYLCRDFPRIPIIDEPEEVMTTGSFRVSAEQYNQYVDIGGKLRKIHLMQNKISTELGTVSKASGDLEIGTIKYKNGILNINKNLQITGIPEQVWNYQIGGYQVIDKWLKEHKGEALNIDSFSHLSTTIRQNPRFFHK